MKFVFILIGTLSFIVGSIGIVLPILPTTPLYLLAAFCFAKGSDRLHRMFTKSKLYQNHLKSFVEERSMTVRNKVILLAFASSMLFLAMIFMEAWYLRMFLIFLMLFKYYYFIFRIKTISISKQIT